MLSQETTRVVKSGCYNFPPPNDTIAVVLKLFSNKIKELFSMNLKGNFTSLVSSNLIGVRKRSLE